VNAFHIRGVEGVEGGGGGDAPCIPVRGHLITQRYAIAHTCTGCTAVQCSRPPLCRAHCPLIPCGTHAFTTAFRHSQCTLACTECNARMASSSFAPTNCLSSALHGDSTSPSLHLLHPANVGCTHSRAPYQLHAPLMFENMCAPPHHKALPCQQSHGLTPTSPTHPVASTLFSSHSRWDVTRWGHGWRSPCPVPLNHPPTTLEYLFFGRLLHAMVCGGATEWQGR